jgi:hypothetical protein
MVNSSIIERLTQCRSLVAFHINSYSVLFVDYALPDAATKSDQTVEFRPSWEGQVDCRCYRESSEHTCM